MFVWAVVLWLTRRDWRRPLVGLIAGAAVFEMLTLMQPSPAVSVPFVVMAGLIVCHRKTTSMRAPARYTTC